MKISDLIEKLEAFRETVGDVPVMFADGAFNNVIEFTDLIFVIEEHGEEIVLLWRDA